MLLGIFGVIVLNCNSLCEKLPFSSTGAIKDFSVWVVAMVIWEWRREELFLAINYRRSFIILDLIQHTQDGTRFVIVP